MTRCDRYWFRFAAVALSLQVWADDSSKVADDSSVWNWIILVGASLLVGQFLPDTWRLTRSPDAEAEWTEDRL